MGTAGDTQGTLLAGSEQEGVQRNSKIPPAGKPTSCLAAAAITAQPQHGLSRSEPGNASPVPISTRKLGWSVSQPPFLTPKSLGHARQPELFGTAGGTSLGNPALPFRRFPRQEPGQPPACQ